jgi:ferritin-like metal-binding protein YciE
MAAKQKTLEDAFYDGLKDVYYAEKTAIRILKKQAKSAEHEELRAAFEQHTEETQGQVQRLEQVFEMIGKAARSKTCEAMQGLQAEAQEHLEDFQGSPAADAVMIGAAQAVEHYEIARYGTLRTWAEQLGHQDAAKLLEQTLTEEKRTDELLSEIAGKLNMEAGGGEAMQAGRQQGRSQGKNGNAAGRA